MMNTEKFCVAGHIFSVVERDASRSWHRVHPAYEPFVYDGDGSPVLEVEIATGEIDLEGLECLVDPTATIDGMPLNVVPYADRATGSIVAAVTQPGLDSPAASVALSADCSRALITVDESATEQRAAWMVTASFTSAMQIAYMSATACLDTLMSHASCVVWGKDGSPDRKAYLFIARSGTGKSTHSRMWLENIPGTVLLNDDHPIVRIVDGTPMAFGSPWSGKTPCYKNMQAPIGAMVRIVRAPHNRILRQHPVAAYASLIASFSGITFVDTLADGRHRAIERLISAVPCYELECLPDADAARVCNEKVTVNNL